MSDVDIILEKTERSFGRRQIQAGHALMVVLARSLPHPVEDVWTALTDPAHLSRWVAEPEGDLRRGGTYALPDGSHGSILRCDSPRLLTVSWVRGNASPSEVEFHLAAEGDGTRCEVRYASVRKGFAYLAAPGAGLWSGGAGWEYFLDGLEAYLGGTVPEELPGLMPDLVFEGEVAALFEARNEKWRQKAEEFEREHAV